VPAEWDKCMAKDWPGVTNKEAFCAWLTHKQTGKWPSEKSAFSLSLPVAKYDEATGKVTGWAALARHDGQPIIDHHGELILIEELEKAAHNLMLDGGTGKAGEMHDRRVGDIVESMIITKERMSALGYEPTGEHTEGWAVTMQLKDETAKARVKSGELQEMSIHGAAQKIPVGERNGQTVKALFGLGVDEISVVDKGASGNDRVSPKIVIAKRKEKDDDDEQSVVAKLVEQFKKFLGNGATETGEVKNMKTLDEILSAMPEEDRAVVLAAMEQAKKEAAVPQQPAVPAPAPAVQPVAMAADEDEDKKKEEMMKSLPEEVRKDFKATIEEVAKLKKDLADRDEREEVAKFRGKASELQFLAGNSTEEIAKTLRAANKALSEKEYKAIEKLLKNANEVVKNSPLFKDKGNPGNDLDMSDPESKILAIAKEFRKADPNLTEAQAVSKAIKENQDLYNQRNEELYK
jgi:hypothetical protein